MTWLRQSVVCVTIVGLFVLAVLANRELGLLGPKTAGVALGAAAVLPPRANEVAVLNGPILPPPPIDIPRAGTRNGPILPPPPIDIPARLAVNNGPILPPPPIDIPAKAGAKNGPILPPPPIDIPSR